LAVFVLAARFLIVVATAVAGRAGLGRRGGRRWR